MKNKTEFSRKDLDVIGEIVARARKELGMPGGITMFMDLDAVHSNGTPLDFQKLLAFGEADFAHDMFGIRENIDRTSGELLNCFLPRCSKAEEK